MWSTAGTNNSPSGAGATSSSSAGSPRPTTLSAYRAQESPEAREARLRALWRQLPRLSPAALARERLAPLIIEHPALTRDRAEKLKEMYLAELIARCGTTKAGDVTEVKWPQFLAYAEAKEAGRCPVVGFPNSLSFLMEPDWVRAIAGLRTMVNIPRRTGFRRERTSGFEGTGDCFISCRYDIPNFSCFLLF